MKYKDFYPEVYTKRLLLCKCCPLCEYPVDHEPLEDVNARISAWAKAKGVTVKQIESRDYEWDNFLFPNMWLRVWYSRELPHTRALPPVSIGPSRPLGERA